MNKASRLIKRYIVLLLVLLFSIESFAAVVGDNDGAAFITKAEFDSLKNDFQSQLDRYNSSIDNKIDGAIAAYLSGISMAKQTDIKSQVSNYNDMRWIKDLQVYGNKRNFTARTTYTTITNGWFDPPHDKRMTLRGDGSVHWTALASSWWWMPICVETQFVVSGNQPIMTGGTYWLSNPVVTSPVVPLFFLFVTADTSSNKTYVDTSEPWRIMDGISNFLSSYNRATTNYEDGTYYTRKKATGRCDENTASATGKLFGYNIYYKTSASGTAAGYIGVIHTTNNTPWPAMNGERTHPTAFGVSATQTSMTSQTDTSVLSALVAAGVNSVSLNSTYKSQQIALMRYLMFGKNCDKLVNVYEENLALKKMSYDVPVTDDSTFISTQIKLKQGYIGQYNGTFEANTDQNVTFSPQNTISFQLPLLPQRKIYVQNSNSFEYNNVYLKYGQGLPLTPLLNENCSVQLKFDYKIYNILTNAEYTSNRKIALSVKNGDYLDMDNIKTTDFYSGQINEASDVKLLNEQSITTTDGKVSVLIDGVKSDQQLWLRLYPDVDTDTTKYYARISNLQVVSIVN